MIRKSCLSALWKTYTRQCIHFTATKSQRSPQELHKSLHIFIGDSFVRTYLNSVFPSVAGTDPREAGKIKHYKEGFIPTYC